MGFLKFLLAVGLVIIGVLGIGAALITCINIGVTSSMFGKDISSTPSWIIGIIAFVILLGGIYMLRKK